MEEEFLLNGKTYTSSQLNQYAKKSNMSLDEYIKESGAVRKKITKAYTLNGKSYDEATIKEYARKSNLSIEEYIKEAGVKKKRVFRAYCSRKTFGFSYETSSAKYFIGYRETNKSCGFGFFRWAN